MWSYEEFLAKAKLYMGRAANHDRADDEFALWLMLGLEFLLRAGLANLNPLLLASPEGFSILAAAGVTVPDHDPKSVQIRTVIDRLRHVIPNFTTERAQEATTLLNYRNAELHSSSAVLANIPTERWLPKLVRVVETVAENLTEPTEDFLTDDIVRLGHQLIDEANAKLSHEITVRLEKHREIFGALRPDELTHRREAATVLHLVQGYSYPIRIQCPACQEGSANLYSEPFQILGERLEDDVITSDVILIAQGLRCNICDLQLDGVAEVHAAGLPQQRIDEWAEELSERYGRDQMDYDYGND